MQLCERLNKYQCHPHIGRHGVTVEPTEWDDWELTADSTAKPGSGLAELEGVLDVAKAYVGDNPLGSDAPHVAWVEARGESAWFDRHGDCCWKAGPPCGPSAAGDGPPAAGSAPAPDLMAQAKGRFRKLLDEADLMQSFGSRLLDGILDMPKEERDALRVACAAHTPFDGEEAAAQAMVLWELDHFEEDDDG